MGDAHDRVTSTDLAGSAVRVKLPDGWDTVTDLLRRLEVGQADMQQALGPQYLLFECSGTKCAVPLIDLREVLKNIPRTIPLPSVPDWMAGIFPIRSEILALVDPLPALYGGLAAGGESAHLESIPRPQFRRGAALIVGSAERSLALIVDGYGGTVTIEEHELDTSEQTISALGLPIIPRYLAGMYMVANTGDHYAVLRVDHLLADLIDALEEVEARYG
jgi:chemotaxis signal transduction protein